jgi:DNA helicase-2/ATP-dependent DNA helicase PcrA
LLGFAGLIREFAGKAARTPAADLVEDLVARIGYAEHITTQVKEAALRGRRLENLKELTEWFRAMQKDGAAGDLAAQLALLSHGDRDDPGNSARLMTLHSAKGLEFRYVFLVGVDDTTLPHEGSVEEGRIEEERRLLYVGVTRARQWLWLSYGQSRSPGGRERRPCRFLPQLERTTSTERAGDRSGKSDRRRTQVSSCRVCGATLLAGADRKLGRCATCPSDLDEELYGRLVEWRSTTAAAMKVPAYVVFTDATLVALAERRPGSPAELLAIAGIGPRKLGQFGAAVFALVGGATPAEFASRNFEN